MGIKSLKFFSSNKFNNAVLASAIGLALGLTGCSSGGGDSAAQITPVTGAAIGGTVSKGIVKGGVVTAQELNASGDVIATVGSATTAADGSYSLTLNDSYSGGPIQISITSNVDTQMKCDVPTGCGTRTDGLTDTDSNIDFSEWYKPTALTMTALIPDAEANETLSVSVTPFTHMAAARAKAGATLDATTIANANSEVSNLLGGIDILNTPPVDITDSTAVNGATSKTQVTYAALASALSNQGFVDANGQPDLNAAINLLASSFTSGVIEADDSDGDDAAQISLQEIVDAAVATFTEAGITDVTGVLTKLQSDIDIAEVGDGTIDPEPGETAADANLDKVKAMMSDVRTWGNVIAAETEASRTAFETQVSLASDAIGALGTANPVDVLDASIESAFSFMSGAGSTDITSYDLGLNTFDSGTIDSTTPGVIVITDGVVHGYTVNITINMPEDGVTSSNFNLGVESATIVSVSSANFMTINKGLVDVTFATDYTVDHTAIDLGTAVLPDVTDLLLDLDITLTQNVDSSGAALASPVTFAGTLLTDLDPIPVTNNPADVMALPKTLNLTGAISNTLGDSVTASLAVNVTNTATFQFVGDIYPVGTTYPSLHLGEPMIQWSYTDTDVALGDDTFTYTSPYNTFSLYWDDSDTQTYFTNPYGSFSIGTYSSLNDAVINSGYFYPYDVTIWISGEGSFLASVAGADFSVDGQVDGLLVEPEYIEEQDTTNGWVDAYIGLTFVAQFDGLPEANINIAADRTGFEAGNGEVTISYGDRQLMLSASLSDSVLDGELTITNQDSVVLTFEDTDINVDGPSLSGSLSYNGIVYGTVKETSNGLLKTTYTDGTFEIF